MLTQKLLISAVLLAGASRMSASVLSYTNRTTLEAVVPILTFANISFDGPVTGDGTFAGGITDVTTGVQFFGSCLCTGVANLLVTTVPGWSASPALREQSSTNESIRVTFPAGVFAFGVDLIYISGPGLTPFDITVTDTTGHSFTTATAVNLPGSVFFGVRSDQAITSADIVSQVNSNVIGLDNFEVGTQQQPAEAAEVSTLLMIGSGLFMLRYARRWMPPGRC